MAVLEKGFNYALTPKSMPKLDIVAGVETGLRQVRDAAAVGIARAKVAAILKSAEPPSNNNITQEEEALNWRETQKLLFWKLMKATPP